MKISFGHKITSGDDLMKFDLDEIAQRICQPEEKLRQQTDILRKIANIDRSSYDRIKRSLPFFCCSTFYNNRRRLEQLDNAWGMIIDIDHLGDQKRTSLRHQLKQDKRVMLLYRSPGGQGLKVVFRFDQSVTNPHVFTEVFRSIAREFAMRYECIQHVDMTTCDATRVSFICADEHAHFNPNARPIATKHHLPAGADTISATPGGDEEKPEQTGEDHKQLDDETYQAILNRLKAKTTRPKREFFVPQQVRDLVNRLERAILPFGMSLASCEDIHYGVKFRIAHTEGEYAEVNIYHGKRGFSIIPSPRKGASAKWNEVLRRIAIHEITAESPRMYVVR